ncbi:MAG: hypothetical protein QOJ16_1690 [Acidobacteriota bacterium]|nr:hypothetical protein [Acidobacteriota bacterium]
MNGDASPQDLDPRVLGARLQEARKARNLTQQEAAETLGLSRPTYMAIEKGERSAQPRELIRLAELYGRSVHELLRQRLPIRDFIPHFRAASSEAYAENPKLDLAVALLQRLAEHYLELEELLHAPLPRNYPLVYDISHLDPVEAAEQVADRERNRLGLGEGPVPHLRDLLEADLGLRIFSIDLPARVSGLFLFTEELGGLIAIQRQHPPGRQLWSLCHEYAHFLVHRYEAEISVPRTDRRISRKERLADHFAKAFLMPASSLRRRFHDLLRTAGQVTPAALLDFAELYGVSFEALLLRSEDLRLLPVGTWQRLKESRFHLGEARRLPGIRASLAEQMLPRRYLTLAVQAYEDEKLTEGELTEILHTDRQRARQMVEEVKSQTEVTLEGETGQLELDLGETLVGIRSGG